MARPKKCRRICAMPVRRKFIPDGACEETDLVEMTIDEFEAIRLLDHENLTQEQCAKQMNVARPTITLIYESARRKIADTIVNGKKLVIAGGDILVCDNAGNCCGKCGKEECANCETQCEHSKCKDKNKTEDK